MPARCVHHWSIEPPHGTPSVHGTCKKCGSGRDFPTTIEPEYGIKGPQLGVHRPPSVAYAERRDRPDGVRSR